MSQRFSAPPPLTYAAKPRTLHLLLLHRQVVKNVGGNCQEPLVTIPVHLICIFTFDLTQGVNEESRPSLKKDNELFTLDCRFPRGTQALPTPLQAQITWLGPRFSNNQERWHVDWLTFQPVKSSLGCQVGLVFIAKIRFFCENRKRTEKYAVVLCTARLP